MCEGRLSLLLLEHWIRRRRGSELVFEAVAAATNVDGHRLVQQPVEQTVGVDVTKYLLDLQPGLATVLQAVQGSDLTRYVHAPHGIHAQQDASDNWTWMLQDGWGSVPSVVDSSLNLLESRLYDLYSPKQVRLESDYPSPQQTTYKVTGSSLS